MSSFYFYGIIICCTFNQPHTHIIIIIIAAQSILFSFQRPINQSKIKSNTLWGCKFTTFSPTEHLHTYTQTLNVRLNETKLPRERERERRIQLWYCVSKLNEFVRVRAKNKVKYIVYILCVWNQYTNLNNRLNRIPSRGDCYFFLPSSVLFDIFLCHSYLCFTCFFLLLTGAHKLVWNVFKKGKYNAVTVHLIDCSRFCVPRNTMYATCLTKKWNTNNNNIKRSEKKEWIEESSWIELSWAERVEPNQQYKNLKIKSVCEVNIGSLSFPINVLPACIYESVCMCVHS